MLLAGYITSVSKVLEKSMPKIKDLTGRTFGRLRVEGLSSYRNANGRIQWDTICTCKRLSKKETSNLISGKSQSCGCLQREVASAFIQKIIPGPGRSKGIKNVRN